MEPENLRESSPVNATYPFTRVLHDLKNPAGVIAGYADMLRRPHVAENPEKVQQYAEKIHFSSKLLLRLIDDLYRLNSSSADLGSVKVTRVQTDRLFQSILEPYALRAMKKSLSFSLYLASPVPRALALDAMRLGQILSNLLDNSIKYTDRGMITVTIGYRAENAAGLLDISVTDSGCGIVGDLQDKIFEPYFRITSSCPDMEGQGIGLASARMIAHQLGGSLRLVWSDIGKGCEFALTLPVQSPDSSEPVIEHIDLAVSSHDFVAKTMD